MRESLFSPLWYRYSQQQPQLKSHVVVQQQQYRDQLWYLLINNQNDEHFRINSTAYAFIGRCNSEHTVQTIWDNLLETLGSEAPTQDEIIQLLNELDQRDLLRYDVMPDVPNLFRRNNERLKKQKISFLNPLAFRLPLWNPSTFLEKTTWLGKLLFNPIMLLVWLMVVLFAAMVGFSQFTALAAHANAFMGSPRYLLIAWLSYPFVKAIHEFGHALAVRYWGGEVRETGITLFLMTPAPYVDASAANGFQYRYQRIVVGAIGIMTELLMAAVALWLFLNVQPGVVKDIAFVILFICSFSTLLFNGNPLLRFDAYYIFCDLLDLPNLATRSRTYWSNLISGLMLGRANTNPLVMATGERKWLFLYAPLSLIYSIVILSAIVFWLGKKSFLLGMIGLLYVLFSLIFKPLLNVVKQTLQSVPAGIDRLKAKATIFSAFIVLLLLFFFVPIPFNTSAQGVVWVQDQARVRPEVAGFIKAMPVKHGDAVQAGQVIMVLEDENLTADKDKLVNSLNKLEIDQFNVWLTDPAKAANVSEEIKNIKTEIISSEEKIASLQVKSQVSGTFSMANQADYQGAFVKKGTVLGYVLNKEPINIKVALNAYDIELVREKLVNVAVRPDDKPNLAIAAEVLTIAPSATNTLPSAALGDRGGGKYATDPADADGVTTVDPIVLIDLKLPNTTFERAGTVASVRFNHGVAPAAQQLYRHYKQLFLRYFNPEN